MAQESIVKQSLEDYMRGIMGCLVAAIAVNGIWWLLALNATGLRQSFEKYAVLYAVLLAISLFIIICVVQLRHGSIVDDMENQYTLNYAYSIGFGFLINIFGVPPQTVQDVLLPGGIWGRIAAVIVAAVITVGILI